MSQFKNKRFNCKHGLNKPPVVLENVGMCLGSKQVLYCVHGVWPTPLDA